MELVNNERQFLLVTRLLGITKIRVLISCLNEGYESKGRQTHASIIC
jgi:hypothetical protein